MHNADMSADMNHQGHTGGIVGQLGKQIAGKHEEGCAWWVSHFQLIGRGYELWAIPEARRGFHGRAIDKRGYEEGHPTQHVVYQSEMFHMRYITYLFSRCKDTQNNPKSVTD